MVQWKMDEFKVAAYFERVTVYKWRYTHFGLPPGLLEEGYTNPARGSGQS